MDMQPVIIARLIETSPHSALDAESSRRASARLRTLSYRRRDTTECRIKSGMTATTIVANKKTEPFDSVFSIPISGLDKSPLKTIPPLNKLNQPTISVSANQ